MKNLFNYVLILALACAGSVQAQSKTTKALHDTNQDALALYFYKNTLRMINQGNSAEFDELIKDIEKMKFLLISKNQSFGNAQFKKLTGDYQKEGYEEIMTSRHEGRNFDVYMKERNGRTEGTVVLVNDSTDLYVLDILGSVPVTKVPQFFQKLDESSDIGKQIKSFADRVEKKSKEN
jgi:hypothetical protein